MATEKGIGSPGNETENHFAAIRKSEGKEAEAEARSAARKHREAQKPVEDA
jgi:hypothetical protein